jgi:hypothetical protein
MATEYADRFCANELRANNKITLREQDIMDVITDASKFTIAAAPGPGESLLANGAASSTGIGDSVPVVFRNLIAGLNTTFTVTPYGLQINSSPTGVATLADGPNQATSLIFDSAGILKTVDVANSITLNTATPGRLIFGLTLTNTGGGASLMQNTGGQFKTVAVSSAVTMSDVAGLVTFGLNLTTTGGATSILSTAGGIFKTLGADAAVTISTTTPGQVRFGLNLTEVGGGISILNSSTGIIRTLTGSAGLVVSNPNANTVGFATNLTDTGANQSLIRDPNAVLFQLATSGAITMVPDGASGPIRFGLALTSVGTGTQLYSNANGVFRVLAAGTGIGVNVVGNAIEISATGVGSLSNASGSGVSLIFATSGSIKTLIQGSGITIADSPSGSVTIGNSGVLQVQSIGSGSSLISASTGTIKSVVQGGGITVSATANELTITNSGVVSISSAGSGTSLVFAPSGAIKSITANRGFTIAEDSGTLTITPPLGSNANHWMRWDTGLGAWKADILNPGDRLLPSGSSANDQYLFSASGGTSWAAITIVSGGVGAGSVLPAVGTSGNVLTSNGTTWASAAPPSGVATLTSAGTGTSLVNNPSGEIKSLAATYGFTIGDSGGTATVTPPLGSNTSHYMHWNTGTTAWEPALLQSGVRLLPVGDVTKDQYLCSPNGSTTWSNIEAAPGGVGLGSVLPAVGASGNVLTSNGTTWASTAPAGGLPSPGASGEVLTSNGSSWISQALPVETYIILTSGSTLPTGAGTWYLRTNGNETTRPPCQFLVPRNIIFARFSAYVDGITGGGLTRTVALSLNGSSIASVAFTLSSGQFLQTTSFSTAAAVAGDLLDVSYTNNTNIITAVRLYIVLEVYR